MLCAILRWINRLDKFSSYFNVDKGLAFCLIDKIFVDSCF